MNRLVILFVAAAIYADVAFSGRVNSITRNQRIASSSESNERSVEIREHVPNVRNRVLDSHNLAVLVGASPNSENCDGDLSLLSKSMFDEIIEIIRNHKSLSVKDMIPKLDEKIGKILIRKKLDVNDRKILTRVWNLASSDTVWESMSTKKSRVWSCFLVNIKPYVVIDAPIVCPPGTIYSGGKCRPKHL